MMRLLMVASTSYGILAQSGGHEVLRLDGADGDDVLVGAPVAHHPHRLDRQQHREDLACPAVELGGDDLLEDDLVAVPQDTQPLVGDVAEDADGEARPGERVAPDDLVGEAEDLPELADLVLEEVAKGLDQLEAELFGQAADVVVELDVGARCRRGRGRTR